jgi:hypothetical protein
MSDDEKSSDKGGGSALADLPSHSMISVLERMLAALEAKARPIQEEIQVLKQLLRNLEDSQFLEDRRQKRAEARQNLRSA